MGLLDQSREWAVFLIDAGILWILVKEYLYDKEWNERRAARRKRVLDKEKKPSITVPATEKKDERPL